MGNLSSFFASKFCRGIIFLFAILVGAGIWGSSSQVYAGGGTFDVPEVNDHFNQVKPGAEPQKPAPVTHTDKEKSGTWDWITEPIAHAWEWTRDKASAFWDGIVDMFSKITEVTVDALSAAWNWILEHETLTVVVLTILGIAAVFFGGGFVSAVGIGVLGGEILGGIVSWFSGNEFMSEAMLEDMLIWGIGTGIGAIVFELIAPFVTGLPFVAAIAGKVPWLGKALPKMFASAAGGGTDQSIIDFLKGQFSWKKTAIVAGLCFVFALGGNYIGNYSDDIIKWINNRNVPNLEQLLISNSGNSLSSTVPKRIGDTPLGQWLQKFSARNQNSVNATQLRNSSGTVSGGINAPSVEKMMRGTQGNIGVIPKEVADQLRGRDFSNFNEFRRAFWRAVANSSYRNEFSSSNITRMNQGTAPIVVKSQQYKGQKSYILHHRNPIHDGGDVYNLDNLIIVTPQMHQEILEKGYHFGK